MHSLTTHNYMTLPVIKQIINITQNSNRVNTALILSQIIINQKIDEQLRETVKKCLRSSSQQPQGIIC